MPVVYMATNTVNGKRYIGATKFSLEKRKVRHLLLASHGSSECANFYRALRKYGSDRFVWTTLATYETREEAFAAEQRLIAELAPEYNIAIGGLAPPQNRPWNCKKVMCLEDGVIFESVESAAKCHSTRSGNISAVCRLNGEYTCNGRHFIYYTTELTEQERLDTIAAIDTEVVRRRKKRIAPKSRIIRYPSCSSSNPLKKTRPVRCVTTGQEFRSIAEAADFYNVDVTALCALCNGRQNRKTVGGLVFKYAEAA